MQDTTVEFNYVASTFSHSAFDSRTNCSVAQCNSSNHSCRSSQASCFEYRTQNNISYCAPASDCSILQPCNNTCSSNSSVCVINSCCEPKARCLPLTFTTFCSLVGWSKVNGMYYSRDGHTSSVLLNGKILIVGGYGCTDILKSAELYDPTVDVWTTAGNMTYGRHHHTTSVLPNGKVLEIGRAHV